MWNFKRREARSYNALFFTISTYIAVTKKGVKDFNIRKTILK